MSDSQSTASAKRVTHTCPKCGGKFVDYVSNYRIYCSQSCGNSEKTKTHGQSKTRIHIMWCCMNGRCRSKRKVLRKYYFDRGITVCQEWQNSFEAFRDWAMANGYTEELEIDRRDNDKGYSPENCRFATRTQQMRNQGKRRDAETSKYKGVSWCSNACKWRVQVAHKGRPVYIGLFKDEIEAAKAYDSAARQRYGEFARVNFKEVGALS